MPDINSIKVGDKLPERSHKPDMVQLFMYNAAIWNPHRIHYDYNYTTKVEHHPEIVVDGPLQGDWLSQTVLEWIGEDAELAQFHYSNRKASYVGETLRSLGTVTEVNPATGEVKLDLRIMNEQDEVITPGGATVRFAARKAG